MNFGRQFTPQTAVAAALRSAEVRRSKGQAPPLNGSHDAAYVRKRVAQVREQIEALNCKISEEQDPQKIDRLVNAVYRLTELERVLSGRPLPGQLRPVARAAPRPNAEPLG